MRDRVHLSHLTGRGGLLVKLPGKISYTDWLSYIKFGWIVDQMLELTTINTDCLSRQPIRGSRSHFRGLGPLFPCII